MSPGHKNVFQGGYWADLHRMLDIDHGDKIMYVGDHMYSDILRYEILSPICVKLPSRVE